MIYLSFLRKLPYHLRKNGQYRAEFAVLHPFVLYSQKSEQHQAYRQQPYIAKAAASYGYGGLPEPVLLSAGIASAYRLQGKQRHWPTKIPQNPVDTYQCLFRNRPELRGYVLAVIGRALVVVAGYMGNIPLMMAFTALAALGQGPWQGDMNAVIASCSEYTYLTQGKRIDGTMYSCTSLGVKIGGGIGTAVVGWMLEFSGYVGTNATQPQSALDMMQFMYLWLPLIFDVLIMFVLSRMNVEDANKKLKAEKGIAADEITDASDMN